MFSCNPHALDTKKRRALYSYKLRGSGVVAYGNTGHAHGFWIIIMNDENGIVITRATA